MMNRCLLAAGCLILLVCVWPSNAQEELDSLKVCTETQKLLFENSFVRVIDDAIPPGVREPKHRHPRGLVIALVDADTETTAFPGGNVVRGHSKAGSVAWSDVTVHETRNPGLTPSHFIRIDLK
jgi:hypothetical protein